MPPSSSTPGSVDESPDLPASSPIPPSTPTSRECPSIDDEDASHHPVLIVRKGTITGANELLTSIRVLAYVESETFLLVHQRERSAARNFDVAAPLLASAASPSAPLPAAFALSGFDGKEEVGN